jgi:hypothetical protein
MTTSAEWQDTGMFGPEQANIDVAYATSLPPDAALAWVETRLAEVQSHFANLGTQRNNLFPIYHLPKDVLSQILSWVALSYSPSASEGDLNRYPTDQSMDFVHLTQTCKLFRSAALERPELWVRVDLRYPSLAKLFLERSGDKPVTVFLYPRANVHAGTHDPTPVKTSTLEILRPHVGRIVHLDLMFTTQPLLGQECENPLAIHMPALQALQLRNVRKDEERAGGSLDSDPPVVPPFVLPMSNQPYPQLRKVALLSVDVPWGSSLFSGLVELDLSYQAHQDPGHAPNIEEFITVLDRCPGLEKLHLCNSGPKEQPDTPATPDARRIQLPRLRDLSIIHNEGRYMDIPLLLSRVSVPLSAKIHIQCREAVDPVICFSQMFPPEHPFLAELPKYGTLKHLHSFTFFHFRLIDESSGGFLSFRVDRHDQNVQIGASILDFFQVVGEPVQYAEIYPTVDSNPWADILERLPNVESMKLKRELDYADFVAALSATKVCPKLKKLSCEYYSHTVERQAAWLTALKARAEGGAKLDEFNLSFRQGAELLTDQVADEFRLYTGKFSREGVV